jgi:hypothetical protein
MREGKWPSVFFEPDMPLFNLLIEKCQHSFSVLAHKCKGKNHSFPIAIQGNKWAAPDDIFDLVPMDAKAAIEHSDGNALGRDLNGGKCVGPPYKCDTPNRQESKQSVQDTHLAFNHRKQEEYTHHCERERKKDLDDLRLPGNPDGEFEGLFLHRQYCFLNKRRFKRPKV